VRALARQRRTARRKLLSTLNSERYFALLDSLERPIATVSDSPTLEDVHAAEHRRLRKAVRELGPESPDEEMHAVRIKVKRARYAAELSGARAYVTAAKELQDVLGEHQDAVVAQERLRALADRLPAASVAAGRLIERERVRADRGRDEWQAAWKRLAKTV
jgi:CHAD domain-containing protein